MAGEHAKSTSATLQNALGGQPCGGELYAAHFLGREAACKLIKLAENNPGMSAAAQFSAAASANKTVFYHADGSAKSVREVYDWALRQPGGADTIRSAPLAPAAAPLQPQNPVVMAAKMDSEMQMLLASVLNWQPRSSFSFGGGEGPSASNLSFGPGLLNLLSDARES